MDVTPEHKLKRYLHYGSELGVYVPGNRYAMASFTPLSFTCTDELFRELKGEFILKTIEEIATNKTYLYIDNLIYALAHCASRKEVTSAFKCAVYRVADKIITKAEHLFAFVRFLKEQSSSKGCYGRGVKRLIHKWYLSKNALELAEIVTTTPKWMGWRHKDLLKLSHISSHDPGKNAVIMYSLKGLDAVKTKFSEVPQVEMVLSYLTTVDDFRKSVDPNTVARLIESYSLTIKHVNPKVIKNKEVWRALLRQMSLADLLDNFSTLTQNKLFRSGRAWDMEFVRSVCDAMGNPSSVSESKLHPNRVFVELYKYKCQASLKLEYVKKKQPPPANPKVLIPPQVCTDIISGMSKLLKASFKNLTPTKKRYLVVIDGGEFMKSAHCGYTRYITPVYAAAIILMTLLKVEKKIEVFTFSGAATLALEPFAVPAVPDIDSLVTSLQAIEKGKIDVRKLIQWAKKNKKEVDAFIVIGGYVRIPQAPVMHEELTKYSETTKVQDSKMVVCSLRGMPNNFTCPEHPRILNITGFDDKVCKLVECFVRGSF